VTAGLTGQIASRRGTAYFRFPELDQPSGAEVVMLKFLPIGFAALMLGLGLGPAAADQVPTDLHLCNADEITDLPALQSTDATDCTNIQSTEPTPKALMCAKDGKTFCCTQKLDAVSNCQPITAGKKRSVAPRDPALTPPMPGQSQMPPPVQPMPMDNTAPQ
jgi:hypothetical protein